MSQCLACDGDLNLLLALIPNFIYWRLFILFAGAGTDNFFNGIVFSLAYSYVAT